MQWGGAFGSDALVIIAKLLIDWPARLLAAMLYAFLIPGLLVPPLWMGNAMLQWAVAARWPRWSAWALAWAVGLYAFLLAGMTTVHLGAHMVRLGSGDFQAWN